MAPHEPTWVELLELVFAGLTVLLAAGIVWQLTGDRQARHREFENMYVQRYWEIAHRLPKRFVQGHDDFDINSRYYEAFVDYVLLCEDEADLRSKGYITTGTWRIWRGGVQHILKVPQLKELVDEFPPDRLERIRNLQAHPTDEYDPLQRSRFGRWWSGLQ